MHDRRVGTERVRLVMLVVEDGGIVAGHMLLVVVRRVVLRRFVRRGAWPWRDDASASWRGRSTTLVMLAATWTVLVVGVILHVYHAQALCFLDVWSAVLRR